MRNEDLCDRVTRLERTLYGDGNGDPGLRMKVDRLEQSRLAGKDRASLYVAAGGVLLVVIIELLKLAFG